MRFLRYLYYILLAVVPAAIKGQNEQTPYHHHWVTDIPIWYNCGGFHALMHYNFKGNGEISVKDEYGQNFIYAIKDGRLVKYHYFNIRNSPSGRAEKHGISAYYSTSASFNYEENSVSHHLRMYRGTGVWHDINFDYQIISNDSILKRCGYENYKRMQTGILIKANDSTVIDTIPMVSPYYTWGCNIRRLTYGVTSSRIKIYANNYPSSALIVEFNNKGDIKYISNNGVSYYFVNHKYDNNGNWTEADIFDSSRSFIRKCQRKIDYSED